MLSWILKKLRKGDTESTAGQTTKRFLTVSITDRTSDLALEWMSSDEQKEFIYRWFELNSEFISDKGGCIDKFYGLEIFSFWGFFESDPQSAQLACECALAQMEAMNYFNDWARQRGYRDLDTRIGINSGPTKFPYPGNSDFILKPQLTVVDAYALQREARHTSSGILVSQSTRDLTKGLLFGERISLESGKAKIEAFPLLGTGT